MSQESNAQPGKYAKKKSKDEVASLKLDHPLKLLVLGRSKDYGRCKSIKKDGEICSALINTSVSPVCVYHINIDYKKMVSSRPELKVTYSGMAPRSALDAPDVNQDIVDKNFALLGPGGVRKTAVKKTLTATADPADASPLCSQDRSPSTSQGSKKLEKKKNFLELTEEEIARKNSLLKQLDMRKELENQMIQEAVKNPLTLAARNLAKVTEATAKKDSKDFQEVDPCKELKELLDGKRKQGARSSTFSSSINNSIKVNLSKFSSANDIFSQMKPVKEELIAAPKPQLGRGFTPGSKSVALDVKPIIHPSNRLQIRIPNRARMANNSKEARDIRSSATKAHAAAVLKRSSSQMSQADDPKSKAEEAKRKKLEAIKKRVEMSLDEEESKKTGQQENKQVRDALEASLKRKSSHQQELKEIELDEQDRYFQYMERKEMLENKIASTTSITVDVVECKTCAYVEVSQSDHCKKLGHTVSKRKADKKFFKCNNCNNKIYIFDHILPVRPCRSCNAASWSKTSMANVSTGPKNPSERLVIRGDEIKFLNSAN
jgi:minichromosome maintenance protein 10